MQCNQITLIYVFGSGLCGIHLAELCYRAVELVPVVLWLQMGLTAQAAQLQLETQMERMTGIWTVLILEHFALEPGSILILHSIRDGMWFS